MNIDKDEFHKGYDAGNYAATYFYGNYWQARRLSNGVTGDYRIGHCLGFFATYAIDEIEDTGLQQLVGDYRARYGDLLGVDR